MTERRKEGRKRKRSGGRAALNSELVGEVGEALLEDSKLDKDSLGPVLARAAALPRQELATVMERVNIYAPKSSTVAEHVRLLEKRATTGPLFPVPVMSQPGSQVSFSPGAPGHSPTHNRVLHIRIGHVGVTREKYNMFVL